MPGDGLVGWYRGIRYLCSYTCLESVLCEHGIRSNC